MSPFICLSLALLTVTVLAVFGFSRTARAAESTKPPPAAPAITAAAVKGLDKVELQRMLGRIDRAPEPELKMGAMCYDMAGPPATVDYVCPTCHAKTVYALGAKGANMDLVWLVAYDLTAARRIAAQIRTRAPGVVLDESPLCRQCTPAAGHPALRLRLTFVDGTSRVVEKVSTGDLRLLQGFFDGKLVAPGAQDDESPLKKDLPRLRELLGFASPVTNAPSLKR